MHRFGWFIVAIPFFVWLGLHTQSAEGHPTGFTRAAHQAEITIQDKHFVLRYSLKTPISPGHAHTEPHQSMSIQNGWLLERNGQFIKWDSAEHNVVSKPHSIESHTTLTAQYSKPTGRFRLSNANLIDTRGFYSTSVHLQRGYGLSSSRPEAIKNAGHRANLAGIWTPDPNSREIVLHIKKTGSWSDDVDCWLTQCAPHINVVMRPSPSIWTAWTSGQRTQSLTWLILLTSMALIGLSRVDVSEAPSDLSFFGVWATFTTLALAIPNTIHSVAFIGALFLGLAFLMSVRKNLFYISPLCLITGIAFVYQAPRVSIPAMIVVGSLHVFRSRHRVGGLSSPWFKYLWRTSVVVLFALSLWRIWP